MDYQNIIQLEQTCPLAALLSIHDSKELNLRKTHLDTDRFLDLWIYSTNKIVRRRDQERMVSKDNEIANGQALLHTPQLSVGMIKISGPF